MANHTVYLEIDASDLQDRINALKSVVKPERFNQIMYSIFQRTGGHVRKILREDLPVDYHVKAGQINKAVGNAHMTSGAGGVGCSIPIVDSRGSIGGRYSASGGAHGWNSLKRKYRVKGKVVKAAVSTLPSKMSSYGNQPPFRNLSAKRLNGVTFTRAGKERYPIEKVVGIAIPQMPMNRSQDEVKQDILDYMKQRIEHEFMRAMRV